MNNFKKAYEINKKHFHSQPENQGYELHHIWGRRGIFLCCRLGMIALNNAEHNSWKVLKQLREENEALRLEVLNNYCHTRGICDSEIDDKCIGCPLTNQTK